MRRGRGSALLPVIVAALAVAYVPAAGSAASGTPSVAAAAGVVYSLYKVTIPVDELDPGPDGNLWFDRNLGGNYTADIGKITPAGKVTMYKPTFSIAGSYPGRIAAGPDHNVWFTLLGEGKTAGVGRLTTAGKAPAAFPAPQACIYCTIEAIAAGPNGEIWTGQQFNVIRRYDTSGALVGTIDLSPWQMPPANVDAIVRGPDGNMWFSAGDWIGAVTPDGAAVGKWLTPSPHPNITDLVVGPDGNLWFTEYDPTINKIGRITPSGHVTEFSAGLPPKAGALRLAVGPDRDIWFTEANYHSLGRITPTGHITQYPIPASLNVSAAGIALGADHHLWVTLPGQGAIARLTLGPACVVPTLKGLHLGAAKEALAKAGCALGSVHGARAGTSPVVVGQSPPAGAVLPYRAKVALTVR